MASISTFGQARKAGSSEAATRAPTFRLTVLMPRGQNAQQALETGGV
eukprot:CAMPEP_0172758818 /NCGR_PEP_ID=MMETSP1074-20121228/166494_1 /TAXON_ID=2916 /ORGANISM="Ceratium fusus, Strain PA161109" /LENGTH=46 /DNA_ID= /DNA_START= /DNA_END= /DNA_ORIENTATION=